MHIVVVNKDNFMNVELHIAYYSLSYFQLVEESG
jgi:hypothetical protein